MHPAISGMVASVRDGVIQVRAARSAAAHYPLHNRAKNTKHSHRRQTTRRRTGPELATSSVITTSNPVERSSKSKSATNSNTHRQRHDWRLGEHCRVRTPIGPEAYRR